MFEDVSFYLKLRDGVAESTHVSLSQLNATPKSDPLMIAFLTWDAQLWTPAGCVYACYTC